MSARRLPRNALLPLVALVLGCGTKPPPKAVEPSPEATAEPAAPPKCEALGEQCKASAATKARIAHADFVVTPVSGWAYAQAGDATVAQAGDAGPATAFAGFDVDAKDAKKAQASREATFEALLKQINVTPPKAKVAWKHPGETKAIAQFKAGNFWQIDAVARGDKKGPLVVFTAPAGDGKELMGVGFVPDDDKSDADEAILKSIDSIHAGTGQ